MRGGVRCRVVRTRHREQGTGGGVRENGRGYSEIAMPSRTRWRLSSDSCTECRYLHIEGVCACAKEIECV